MISVVRRKLITSELSFFTSAPITPSEVRRKYSKGRDLEVVLRKGYRKRGMWAIESYSQWYCDQNCDRQSNIPFRNRPRVSL